MLHERFNRIVNYAVDSSFSIFNQMDSLRESYYNGDISYRLATKKIYALFRAVLTRVYMVGVLHAHGFLAKKSVCDDIECLNEKAQIYKDILEEAGYKLPE